MENKNKHQVKMVLKNGHVIALHVDDAGLDEMVSHPKFLRMFDDANDVFMSIDDVTAFEITSNRKEADKPPENDEFKSRETESAQQA